jgi:hypothetical protein
LKIKEENNRLREENRKF